MEQIFIGIKQKKVQNETGQCFGNEFIPFANFNFSNETTVTLNYLF
jgi:hypothetical protein